MIHDKNDITNVGKHDFDKPSVNTGTYLTFSIGIFKWKRTSNGWRLKKSKSIVRVSGPCDKSEEVFAMADNIRIALDNGDWDGRKNVRIK